MNDNRLYIMKDFTYALLCKHLHKRALYNTSLDLNWRNTGLTLEEHRGFTLAKNTIL